MTGVAAALLATAVAGRFAWALGRQYAARRRPHALAWCVPFLAVGQLHLLAPHRARWWWGVAMVYVVLGVVAVVATPMRREALTAATAIPAGEDVFAGGLALALLPLSNWAAAVVVAGSLWSGVRTRRWGVLLIAVGVVVAGSSFAFVRRGHGELVSVALAVGVATMYAGFVAAGAPGRG